MTAAEEKLAVLLAAHLRGLEWHARYDDDARAVLVVHPDRRQTVAVISVADGEPQVLTCEPAVYRAGIDAAIRHVQTRRAA